MSNFNAMKATLQALTGHQNMIATPKALIEFVGELDGGTLLSQLIYYSDKGKRRDGFFYKTYEEWHSEIYMSEYRIRKWVKVFKEAGWLETKIKKANGNPTVHYRFNFDTFSVSFLEFLRERNQRNLGNDTLKTSESLTETTTQTTAKKEPVENFSTPPVQTQEEIDANLVGVSRMLGQEPPKKKEQPKQLGDPVLYGMGIAKKRDGKLDYVYIDAIRAFCELMPGFDFDIIKKDATMLRNWNGGKAMGKHAKEHGLSPEQLARGIRNIIPDEHAWEIKNTWANGPYHDSIGQIAAVMRHAPDYQPEATPTLRGFIQ